MIKPNKCPKCHSKQISNIPSSTLPIKDEKYLWGKIMGKRKVSKRIMKKHLSIKHICTDCLYEW